MNILQEALIALLSGLATKNEDGSINWENKKILPLDTEKQTYIVEYANGDKHWFLNGKLHREDGPAYEGADGDKGWYLNDQLHREDGPAVDHSDAKSWWINGKLHREDGPAIEWANGGKSWWLNDQSFREEDYKRILR